MNAVKFPAVLCKPVSLAIFFHVLLMVLICCIFFPFPFLGWAWWIYVIEHFQISLKWINMYNVSPFFLNFFGNYVLFYGLVLHLSVRVDGW